MFIPRSLQPAAQVDTIGKHGQRGGLERDLFAPALDVLRPAEGALFEALGHHPVAGAIEVEDLDEVTPLVGEEESGSTARIHADGVARHGGQTIEAFAHVAGLERDIDLEVAVEAEHGRII